MHPLSIDDCRSHGCSSSSGRYAGTLTLAGSTDSNQRSLVVYAGWTMFIPWYANHGRASAPAASCAADLSLIHLTESFSVSQSPWCAEAFPFLTVPSSLQPSFEPYHASPFQP